ncbi:SDR family oxidoreductase [Candidatus Pseudothioglobus singularis]|nr:SDR family oxidoreductase [Candidatus Pseudothioglobus singularis]
MNKKLDSLFRLDGKVIVITGAAGLMGKMHAEAVAAYGGTPVLLDLLKDDVEKYAYELNKKFNINAVGMMVNITNEKEIEKNVKDIIKQYGKIDGLVNNAANNPKIESNSKRDFSRLENFSLEVWQQDINVGLTGSYLCAKHYGNLISKNNNGGSIVNISSDLGLIGPDQRLYMQEGVKPETQAVKPVTYSVVKAGLIGLTRYLATYWADKNVRANAICPGGIETNQTDEFLKKVSSRIPMNRLAKPNEYQGTLVWMLSDASSYLNGAIIPVEGGRTAW